MVRHSTKLLSLTLASLIFWISSSPIALATLRSTGPLRLRMEALTDFRLALPENESFLKADLSKNASDELAYAEQAH